MLWAHIPAGGGQESFLWKMKVSRGGSLYCQDKTSSDGKRSLQFGLRYAHQICGLDVIYFTFSVKWVFSHGTVKTK